LYVILPNPAVQKSVLITTKSAIFCSKILPNKKQ